MTYLNLYISQTIRKEKLETLKYPIRKLEFKYIKVQVEYSSYVFHSTLEYLQLTKMCYTQMTEIPNILTGSLHIVYMEQKFTCTPYVCTEKKNV